MMYKILTTNHYDEWFKKLRNSEVKIRIIQRILRISEDGYFGDHKTIDNRLFELRIHAHGGYRIYYTVKNNEIVLLLIGGDKDTQEKDIKKAKEILIDYMGVLK